MHRQVRTDLMKWLKPGMTMIDIVQRIERNSKHLVQADGLKRGWGFPTGTESTYHKQHLRSHQHTLFIASILRVEI